MRRTDVHILVCLLIALAPRNGERGKRGAYVVHSEAQTARGRRSRQPIDERSLAGGPIVTGETNVIAKRDLLTDNKCIPYFLSRLSRTRCLSA